MAKDFNHLKKWLETKMRERRIWYNDLWKLTIQHDPAGKGITARTLYNWTEDKSRPSSQNAAKVVHVLSKIPAWDVTGTHSMLVEVPLEEMLKQFIERPVGYPKGTPRG